MDTPRVRCTAPRCRNTILPETAARTGGVCRPCYYELAAKEHAEYVRANRVTIDPFAGIDDPVRILELLTIRFTHDELVERLPWRGDVEQLVTNLTAAQVAAVTATAVAALDAEDDDRAEKLALRLATWSDADLGALQRAWIEREFFRPALLFRGAPADVRDALLHLVETHADRHEILSALAWTGEASVPEEYAHRAGWELDAHGRRRELASPVALPLVAANAPAPPVYAVESLDERCPWCRSPFTRLFRLDTRDPRLAFLGVDRDTLDLTTCAHCVSLEGPLFMKLDDRGSPRWHPANARHPKPKSKRQSPWIPRRPLVAVAEPRTRYRAAEPFLPSTVTQVGGLPGWLQHAEYLTCPECSTTMRFVAQLAREEVEEDAEGVYYAMLCDACAVTGTVYQQT